MRGNPPLPGLPRIPVSGTWYYELSYVAPTRHYFGLDANTFERFVLSFKLFRGHKRRFLRQGSR